MTINPEAFAKALAAGIAAYEAAVVANSDGWIAWNGGKQPVKDETRVETKFSDGSGSENRACVWDWHDKNLVAYRVVQ